MKSSDLKEWFGRPVVVQISGPLLICGIKRDESGQALRRSLPDGSECGEADVVLFDQLDGKTADGEPIFRKAPNGSPLLSGILGPGIGDDFVGLEVPSKDGAKLRMMLRMDTIVAITGADVPSRLVL